MTGYISVSATFPQNTKKCVTVYFFIVTICKFTITVTITTTFIEDYQI